MDKIAVLFPASDASLTCARDDWEQELDACSESGLFLPVLYNEDDFIAGSDLTVSEAARQKKSYCIRRGRMLEDEDRMRHSLKRAGYAEALRNVGIYRLPWSSAPSSALDIEERKPKSLQPYHRYYRGRSEEYGWFPDLHVFQKLVPCVAKGCSGTLKDGAGRPVVFEELSSWAEIERVIAEMSDRPLDEFNDTFWPAPMRFEEFVDIASVDGVPVEWRAFFYEGRLVYSAPKYAGGSVIPEPPTEMLARRPYPDFCALDFARDVSGMWWVLKEVRGEEAHVPAGGPPLTFYERLAQEIERGPEHPGWCWCLVADIVSEHAIGERKVTVPGSRHFGPGTKVCISSAYWGLGAERCTVVGVPKYSDYPVGVSLQTSLLRNFRLERITDPALLKALYTNRLREPFELDRDTNVDGLWSTTDKDKTEIEGLADMFNKRMRNIDAGMERG